MRVGLFSDYYLAHGDGTAESSRLSRRGLAELGHQVKVFCPLLKNHNFQPRVTAFPSLPGGLYPGLRLSWPFRRKYFDLVKADKLDVAHIQTPIFVGLFGLVAARKLKIPTVTTVHLDMDFMGSYGIRLPVLAGMAVIWACLSRRLGKMFWRVFWPRRTDKSNRRTEDFAWRAMAFVASCCDLVIAPSQKNYDQLAKYLPRSKLRLVPNGILLEKPENGTGARQRLGLSQADFIVISTARLVREKRIEMILTGFAGLARSEPRAKLLILNQGPAQTKLVRLAQQLGISQQVVFVGLVDQTVVRRYLSAADVFVNVCLREVASLGVLEAAACALPLLLADRRLAEPMADGENGFWVNSQQQIGRRLAQLYQDKALCTKLGEASYKRVSQFSLGAHAKKLSSVYAELTEPD